jgi:hypothetical protein
MIEKAKQDKLNNQRIREERERLAALNSLLSPRSQRPLPEYVAMMVMKVLFYLFFLVLFYFAEGFFIFILLIHSHAVRQKNYYECESCGFENIDYVKFCENCGNCQPQSKQPPQQQQQPSSQPVPSPFARPLQMPQVQCTMYCGFLNDLGKKFCESCGASVGPHVQCNVNGCGKWNDASRNFCEGCGAKLVQPSLPGRLQLFIVVVCCLFVFFFLFFVSFCCCRCWLLVVCLFVCCCRC